MKVLSIIMGIIMAILGISLAATPILTFMATGYYLAILLLIYGILGIIGAIVVKKYGVGFVFSIISTIAGIAMIALPGMIVVTDFMLVYCMAVWFILQGVIGIFNSITAKKLGSKVWGWGLAFGIIGVIVGIYSFCHPFITAATLGILISIYFIQAGINMIIAACSAK